MKVFGRIHVPNSENGGMIGSVDVFSFGFGFLFCLLEAVVDERWGGGMVGSKIVGSSWVTTSVGELINAGEDMSELSESGRPLTWDELLERSRSEVIGTIVSISTCVTVQLKIT